MFFGNYFYVFTHVYTCYMFFVLCLSYLLWMFFTFIFHWYLDQIRILVPGFQKKYYWYMCSKNCHSRCLMVSSCFLFSFNGIIFVSEFSHFIGASENSTHGRINQYNGTNRQKGIIFEPQNIFIRTNSLFLNHLFSANQRVMWHILLLLGIVELLQKLFQWILFYDSWHEQHENVKIVWMDQSVHSLFSSSFIVTTPKKYKMMM